MMWWLDGTAVPLTPSLGKGWREQRRVGGRGEGGSGKVRLVLNGKAVLGNFPQAG